MDDLHRLLKRTHKRRAKEQMQHVIQFLARYDVPMLPTKAKTKKLKILKSMR